MNSSFPPTRWTVIVAAQGKGDEARLALDALYWQPVYAFLRRRGNSPSDAEDLTQGFVAELLSRGSLDTMADEIPAEQGIQIHLVLDNAGWHKTASLNWHHIKPVYLAPYSPDFNPIERLWQHL